MPMCDSTRVAPQLVTPFFFSAAPSTITSSGFTAVNSCGCRPLLGGADDSSSSSPSSSSSSSLGLDRNGDIGDKRRRGGGRAASSSASTTSSSSLAERGSGSEAVRRVARALWSVWLSASSAWRIWFADFSFSSSSAMARALLDQCSIGLACSFSVAARSKLIKDVKQIRAAPEEMAKCMAVAGRDGYCFSEKMAGGEEARNTSGSSLLANIFEAQTEQCNWWRSVDCGAPDCGYHTPARQEAFFLGLYNNLELPKQVTIRNLASMTRGSSSLANSIFRRRGTSTDCYGGDKEGKHSPSEMSTPRRLTSGCALVFSLFGHRIRHIAGCCLLKGLRLELIMGHILSHLVAGNH
ncbi:hypothetical protein EJB05_42126, partial [Eragrostis curvula]